MRFNSREDDAIDSSHGDNNFVIRERRIIDKYLASIRFIFFIDRHAKCQVLCIVDERTNFQNFVNEKRETNGYRNEILFYSKVSSRYIYIYILKIENEEKKKKGKKKILSSIFHETTFSILAIETEN